ncbi:odorant receptor 94b-like [Diachasmimorpha longicaudata]|uniref:odorant receptor 94b-like n=1 Tax=Diachasmimorpha longicaudata TaxID=58733 RepID=UPI0030B88E9B
MLPYSIALLRLWGVWVPQEWWPTWRKKLYPAYTVFVICFVYANTLSQIIELFTTYETVKGFINKSFILLSTIAGSVKGAHCILHRQEFINLAKTLESYPCRPETLEEEAIQREFNKKIKHMNRRYITMHLFTITTLTIASILRDVPKGELYYKAWIPFDYTSPPRFWSAYIHQVIAHYFDLCMHAGYDTLAPGMMIHACAQFAILGHRFRILPQRIKEQLRESADINECHEFKALETKKLTACVRHHLQIFEFAKTNNNIFSGMIFMQYTVSSLVLCMSTLRLSQIHAFSPTLLSIFLYFLSMIVQIFMPCFAGNQITIASERLCNDIYSMDWTILSTSTKRSLAMIIARAQKPLKFTSGYILTLSIDSFNSVVKTSYSAFNVLHGSSDF